MGNHRKLDCKDGKSFMRAFFNRGKWIYNWTAWSTIFLFSM